MDCSLCFSFCHCLNLSRASSTEIAPFFTCSCKWMSSSCSAGMLCFTVLSVTASVWPLCAATKCRKIKVENIINPFHSVLFMLQALFSTKACKQWFYNLTTIKHTIFRVASASLFFFGGGLFFFFPPMREMQQINEDPTITLWQHSSILNISFVTIALIHRFSVSVSSNKNFLLALKL